MLMDIGELIEEGEYVQVPACRGVSGFPRLSRAARS